MKDLREIEEMRVPLGGLWVWSAPVRGGVELGGREEM